MYIKSLHLFSRKSSEKESDHIRLLLEGKISFGLQKKKSKKICEPSEMLNPPLSRSWSDLREKNVLFVDLHNPSFEFALPLVLTLLYLRYGSS